MRTATIFSDLVGLALRILVVIPVGTAIFTVLDLATSFRPDMTLGEIVRANVISVTKLTLVTLAALGVFDFFIWAGKLLLRGKRNKL